MPPPLRGESMNVKIDKRHNYFMTIDTETCNGFRNPFTYDIGWGVGDSRGRTYQERSFVVSEIFDNEKDLMASAYYSNKLPQYYKGIPVEWLRERFAEIHRQMAEDIKTYNIKAIIAHNAKFDFRALNVTCLYLFGIDNFFDFGIPILDSLEMAKLVFPDMPTYTAFCEKNGFTTKAGKPRLTAEIIYRYLIKDNDFTEQHTGLADVRIEMDIFAKCVQRLGVMKCMECQI